MKINRSFPVAYQCVGGPRGGSVENLWAGDTENGSIITFFEGLIDSSALQYSEYKVDIAECTLTFIRMNELEM
jgi:hypothetical protein